MYFLLTAVNHPRQSFMDMFLKEVCMTEVYFSLSINVLKHIPARRIIQAHIRH